MQAGGSAGKKGRDNAISPPEVSYLLVSPLLPPLSFLLTLSPSASRTGLRTVADGLSVTGRAPEEALTNHESFAIYGDSDCFTPVRRLRDWAKNLSQKPDSHFKCLEIPGAGHFWRESDTPIQLRSAMRQYIDNQSEPT